MKVNPYYLLQVTEKGTRRAIEHGIQIQPYIKKYALVDLSGALVVVLKFKWTIVFSRTTKKQIIDDINQYLRHTTPVNVAFKVIEF